MARQRRSLGGGEHRDDHDGPGEGLHEEDFPGEHLPIEDGELEEEGLPEGAMVQGHGGSQEILAVDLTPTPDGPAMEYAPTDLRKPSPEGGE